MFTPNWIKQLFQLFQTQHCFHPSRLSNRPHCIYLLYHMPSKGRKIHLVLIFTARIRSMTGRYCFHRCLSVNISGGGVPSLRFLGGGSRSQDFGEGRGGTRSQIFGGVPGLRFSGGGGGYPVLVKGKIFDSRFGLIHVQTGKKKFLLRDPPLQ